MFHKSRCRFTRSIPFSICESVANDFVLPTTPAGAPKANFFFGFPRHKLKLNCSSSAPLTREIFSRDVTARRVFEGRRFCGNHLGDDFRSFAQVLHIWSYGRTQKAAIWKSSIKFEIRYVTYVMPHQYVSSGWAGV